MHCEPHLAARLEPARMNWKHAGWLVSSSEHGATIFNQWVDMGFLEGELELRLPASIIRSKIVDPFDLPEKPTVSRVITTVRYH